MSQVLHQLTAEASSMGRRPRLMERFAGFLPLTSATPRISLGEGSTPLVRSAHIGPSIGIPTSSTLSSRCPRPYRLLQGPRHGRCRRQGYRGGRQGRPLRLHRQHQRLRCGLRRPLWASPPYVFLPKGGAASGKLAQSVAYGAQVVAIQGTFDDALRLAREFTAKPHPVSPPPLVNSVNAYRIQGQKTAAFEICRRPR